MRKGKAVPTNLSVLFPASSPNDKVPRNWRAGQRCCLYRTMTCRILWKIRHFFFGRKQSDTPPWSFKPPLFLLLSGNSTVPSFPFLFFSSGALLLSRPHSLFEEVRLSVSRLFPPLVRRRVASVLKIIVGIRKKKPALPLCVCGRCCRVGEG